MRAALVALLLFLAGCDGCRQQSDPMLWLSWHSYRPLTLERLVQPTIGTWPCESWQEGWRAVATRTQPEWEGDCGTVRAVLIVCCPSSNTGPCRGREVSTYCDEGYSVEPKDRGL